MANWHYYTENRDKIGPVTGRELKQLVRQGTVTPDTFVEDPTGRTGLAKDVNGLKFPEAETTIPEPFIATPSPFVPTIQTVPMPPVTPPPGPKKVFCTNCGNTVAEQAVACMSCGARPIGHKKFCRHCAVALNPEQVICIQCKSEIGTENIAATFMAGVKRAIPPDAATSFMTGIKRILPPNVAASIPEKIKKLPKPAIIAGIAIVAGIFLLFIIGNVATAPRFTAAERAEVDKFLADHGRDAIVHYMGTLEQDVDTNRALRYIRYFVSKGADVNAKDRWNNTPLLLALRIGNVEIARYFLSRRADVNSGAQGDTPLLLALAIGEVGFARELVARGADVNARDRTGDTPLHLVNNLELIKLLVSNGADVNAQDTYGITPLHHAAGNGNIDAIKFLVSEGADVNAVARRIDTFFHILSNATPLDLARRIENAEVVRYLESVGAKTRAEL